MCVYVCVCVCVRVRVCVSAVCGASQSIRPRLIDRVACERALRHSRAKVGRRLGTGACGRNQDSRQNSRTAVAEGSGAPHAGQATSGQSPTGNGRSETVGQKRPRRARSVNASAVSQSTAVRTPEEGLCGGWEASKPLSLARAWRPAVLGPLLVHFWSTFGPLLVHFWSTFGPRDGSRREAEAQRHTGKGLTAAQEWPSGGGGDGVGETVGGGGGGKQSICRVGANLSELRGFGWGQGGFGDECFGDERTRRR